MTCGFYKIKNLRVWIPYCMGGAVHGNKNHCTCKSNPVDRISELERKVQRLENHISSLINK